MTNVIKNYNNNDPKTTASPRLTPDDICPIHGGHKWHYCIFNNEGPNYRPSARNKATKTSVKGSTNNFNHEQINKNNDDEITSVTPDDGKFNSVDHSNEPVPQVITEGISPASDKVFTFMKCLLNSGSTKSLIPLSRLPRSFPKHKSVTLPYHHQAYISIISTLHFTIYVSPNSAPISGWKT